MYDHDLKKMAENLEEAGLLIPVLEPEMAVKQATECMQKSWEDKIAITWCVDDVLHQAKCLDDDGHLLENAWMSKEEALDILHNMRRKHDSEIGINWTVIDCHVDWLKYEKEDKDGQTEGNEAV